MTTTAPRSLLTAHRPAAPAVFIGVQEGIGHIPAIELYNLTADIDGHNTGSTVSRQTLEAAGYLIPSRAPMSAAAAPVFVPTPSREANREARRLAWYFRNHAA